MLVFTGVISMKTRQQETRKAIPLPKHPWLQVDYGHEEAWNFAAKKGVPHHDIFRNDQKPLKAKRWFFNPWWNGGISKRNGGPDPRKIGEYLDIKDSDSDVSYQSLGTFYKELQPYLITLHRSNESFGSGDQPHVLNSPPTHCPCRPVKPKMDQDGYVGLVFFYRIIHLVLCLWWIYQYLSKIEWDLTTGPR